MNFYYLRCIESDYPQLIALGKLLGVITVLPPSTEVIQRPTGFTPDNVVKQAIPYDPDEDYDHDESEQWNADYKVWYEANPDYELVNLGGKVIAWETVTIAHPERVVTVSPADYWDFIGTVPKPTGKLDTDGNVLTSPAADKGGNVYVHVNLLTSINLREAAQAMAAKYPEVREGLASMSKYFLLDAEGNAIAPAQPHRVFAT